MVNTMSAQRVKHSIGKNYTNEANIKVVAEEKFVLNNESKYFAIDVIPMGAVRMTQSDKWKTNPNHTDPKKRQRKPVQEYFKFKDSVVTQSNAIGYIIKDAIDVVFFIPMPHTWSEKKKKQYVGMPHKQKPDTDNILKGFCDALTKDDSTIWSMSAKKYWAYKGSILIYC